MDWIPPGVRTSDRAIDLAAASRDLWPGGTLDFWQGRDAPMPARVAWPRDEAEVEALVRAAAARGVPVVPYGAGSGVCGGARGRPGSLVLDTKAMDRIGTLDRERWTVEAGPGVLGQHLEDWLNARGFTLGHSPSSIWCSTVGGWAAARSAGQFSSRYGVFEDMVLSLRAVSPSRGAFQVGEGGDAPDAWLELLLGSEGTLGVITGVKMRVWPLPAARELRGWRFPDVESAVRAMRRLMQGELWPAVVRLYDPVDTRIGGRTRPEKHDKERHHAFYREWLAAIDGMPSVRKRLLALPLALPGLVNRVFDGLASGCLLIVGWEGDPEVVRAASDAGRAVLSEEGEDLGPDPGERWFHSRHHVSYKLMPIFERGGFADTMEVACRWSDLVGVYEAVRAALSRNAIVMAHMSHVYPEGGSIYFSFAGRGDPEVYRRTWKAALEAVLAAGGTVTHHHGVGELKAEAASTEIGPAVAGWKAAKAELDPDAILNPGRLFVDAPYVEPRPIDPRPEDHLAIGPATAPFEARSDALWPWESLPGPQRWCRQPWQAAWIEVEGHVDGKRCLLGRGPRSAAGPDLRAWLASQDPGARVTWAAAPEGPRWMGEVRVDRPWAVALELLRSDLRPAVLTVVGGALRVGFRGPAAAAMGAIASRRVAGGLAEVPFAPEPLPSGALEPCSVDDPDVVAVNIHGALRPRAGSPGPRGAR